MLLTFIIIFLGILGTFTLSFLLGVFTYIAISYIRDAEDEEKIKGNK